MTAAVLAPNVLLLRQTLTHIAAHPGDWKQAEWRCRSGMCFAGTACHLDGGQWAYSSDNRMFADLLIAEAADDDEDVCPRHGDGPVIPANERAQRILGLTDDQADRLFDEDNTLADLRRIVSDLCGGAL